MLILGCLGDPAPQRDEPWHLGSEWNSGWYHNSAAALLDDDRVIAAVEEERLTRRKHSGKFPFRAIEACLAAAGVSLADVDRIAFGERGGDGPYRDPRISAERIAAVLHSHFPGQNDLLPKIRLVEHHVGHALSAFVPSRFEHALVFSCDGFGDGISALVAIGRDGRIERTLDTFSFADSLGRFYSSTLDFLGYGSGDEYKVMGLAPYGDPSVHRELFQSFYELLPEGRFRIAFHEQKAMTAALAKIAPKRDRGGAFLREHEHVAAAIQEAFERIVFHVLTHWQQRTGERHLCL
ncbi:MAG TPA: carbamoyltransferase N-terminal domain-containing protein, partial [Thermoanaerobaculia bacterium]|nr:carbamoyltransferase N-terminal domain-containing protein [Thermoanaerobaculia bacterium]